MRVVGGVYLDVNPRSLVRTSSRSCDCESQLTLSIARFHFEAFVGGLSRPPGETSGRAHVLGRDNILTVNLRGDCDGACESQRTLSHRSLLF